MDIALYNTTGEITEGMAAGYVSRDESTTYAPADSACTRTQTETIAGKVLKFLLTYRGTDAFYPEYGGTALHWKNFSPSRMQEFRMELQDDIVRCIDFMRQKESSLPAGSDRLLSIQVAEITYAREADPTRLDVHLVITTAQGNMAAVRITTAG